MLDSWYKLGMMISMNVNITACYIPSAYRTHVCFYLSDGRYISIPVSVIPKVDIDDASSRADFKISEDGQRVVWKKLGFEISLKQILSQLSV